MQSDGVVGNMDTATDTGPQRREFFLQPKKQKNIQGGIKLKKAVMFFICVLLVAICVPAFAAQFPDVPTDHWAYSAVQDLSDKGIVQGYPDGTFSGKRALTRYEFAQALSKAIPTIAAMVSTGEGQVGPAGPAGPAGPVGPAGVSDEQLKAIQRLVDEFRDELAAQGVDIAALKKDVAVLSDRVAAVEAEQARVKITAEANFIGRGTVNNNGVVFDRDGRAITGTNNFLQNSTWFNDFDLGIKGKVSNSASVTALINAGSYLPFALNNTANTDDFTLWNLYLNSAVNLGPLGGGQVTVGRLPFQLTPLTLKFINPDSYNYVSKLQNGDYALDGATMSFKLFNTANVTAFAAKSINNFGVDVPVGVTSVGGATVTQLAGARAVIGTPFAGNLGLTYYVATPGATVTSVNDTNGRMQVLGADLKANIFGLGFAGEFGQTNPSDFLEGQVPATGDDNNAWNANLSYNLGKLNIGGGYTEVEANYAAPGYWSRMGRAVNLQNVKGEVANISYALTPKLILSADGSFLQPKNDTNTITFREAGLLAGDAVAGVDEINGFKAGLKYGLTAANSIDLGWEQNQWKSTVAGTSTAKENYYTVGLGHTFNSNSSLKVLYQIEDYKAAGFGPFGGADYRGGVASAQFQLKY